MQMHRPKAHSELRICHYQMHQFLTLKGPLRASISRDGVVIENSKTVVTAAGSRSALGFGLSRRDRDTRTQVHSRKLRSREALILEFTGATTLAF